MKGDLSGGGGLPAPREAKVKISQRTSLACTWLSISADEGGTQAVCFLIGTLDMVAMPVYLSFGRQRQEDKEVRLILADMTISSLA